MRVGRALHRFLTAVTLLAMLAGGTTARASAAHAETTTTSTVTLVGEQGTIAGARSLLWRSGVDTLRGSVSYADGVYLSAEGAPYPHGDDFNFTFTGARGAPLTVGSYENAARARVQTEQPGLDIGGNGQGCNVLRGRFDVLDLDAAQDRFWIVFEQECDNSYAAMFGEIRYNEPADADLLVTPRHITWPQHDAVGTVEPTVPVTLINTGADAVTVGSAAIIGPGASQFAVLDNSCTSLPPGASCTVDVLDTVPSIAHRDATLTITDSTAAGSHTVALQGGGLNPADPAVARTIGKPPGAVSAASFYTAFGDLVLSWTNPDDVDWVETLICAAPGTTPPPSPESCPPIYRGRDSTFTAGSLLDPGATESVSFFAIDAEGLASPATSLVVPGTTLSADAQPPRVTYGKKFTISGVLRDAITNAPLEFCDLLVYAVDPYTDQTFDPDRIRTTAGGKYTYTWNPGENYVWYVVFSGDDTHNGTISRPLGIPVSKAVHVDPLKKKDVLKKGVTLYIGVDPLSPGTKVTIEQLVQGKWKKVGTAKLNKNSVAKVTYKPKVKGTYTYRATAPEDQRSVAGVSRPAKVTLT